MTDAHPPSGTPARHRDRFLLIAGVAGLLTQVDAIVINIVLLAPPPDPPTLNSPIGDVAAYVAAKGDMLALGHGLRYVAQVLLLIFGVGLYRLVRGSHDGAHRGWAVLGLLATIWVPAVGIVANSIEGVAVWQSGTLAEQPQLALALWGLSSFLWSSLLVPFSTLVLGYSLAGRGSGAFPPWLVWLGLAISITGLGAAILTAASARDGLGVSVHVFLGLLLPWTVITSLRMIGSARR